MESRLQRRAQRYGWDLAADAYDQFWKTQLAGVQTQLLACAVLKPGERVLAVACGSGQVAFSAAEAVGPSGRVVGVDLSGQMVESAGRGAKALGLANVDLARMDAENLALPDAHFSVRCVRLASSTCPNPPARCTRCAACERRIAETLEYANADDACDAAFAGGPVALAWSRFDANVRARVRARYVKAIEPWRVPHGYRIPAEFVVVSAAFPQRGESPWRSGNLPAA